MKIYLSEDADADLVHIHSYLVDKNRPAAISLAREMEEKFVTLSRFPFIGRDRSSLMKGAGA